MTATVMPASDVMEQADEIVRALVDERLDGVAREQVLSMLFDVPLSRLEVPPSRLNEGQPLREDVKELIRQEIRTSDLSTASIADKFGVSPQAVVGVRVGMRHQRGQS
jgi:hypothetical protein